MKHGEQNGTSGFPNSLFVVIVLYLLSTFSLRFQSSRPTRQDCCVHQRASSVGSSNNQESLRSCFDALQAASNQHVRWKLADVSSNPSDGDSITSATSSCPRLAWTHEIPSQPECKVEAFDAQNFVSLFRGRTLVFLGDSMARMSCANLQDILKDAGVGANTIDSSYRGIDPYRKRMNFGCHEYVNGILICCGWIGFSNARNERKIANLNMFSNENGALVNVLEPADLVVWNFGIHHTRQFGGDENDIPPLIHETLSNWNKKKEDYSLPSIWWKECYAQHWTTGHWMSRSQAKKGCRDISHLSIENETGIYNPVAEKALEEFQIPIFRVYKASMPLYMAHKNRDCTHFCTDDFGPMDHDNALLGSLLQYAIGSGTLPELAHGRNETNGFQIQQRWDLLMEHPTKSVIARLESCANPQRSGKGHEWNITEDGPIPAHLQECLDRTDRISR